jgi:Cu-Zn family superoxide dismutase
VLNSTVALTEASLLDTDGSAIVIHASADDYKTDPAGNAGDRIACGVITP